MKAVLWAVAFSRLLDRPLIQSFNPPDLNTRDTRPDHLPFIRSGITPELTGAGDNYESTQVLDKRHADSASG
jgi:hypothetical protein